MTRYHLVRLHYLIGDIYPFAVLHLALIFPDKMYEPTLDDRARSIRYGLHWTRRAGNLRLLLLRFVFAILKTVTAREAIVS